MCAKNNSRYTYMALNQTEKGLKRLKLVPCPDNLMIANFFLIHCRCFPEVTNCFILECYHPFLPSFCCYGSHRTHIWQCTCTLGCQVVEVSLTVALGITPAFHKGWSRWHSHNQWGFVSHHNPTNTDCFRFTGLHHSHWHEMILLYLPCYCSSPQHSCS